MKKNTIILKNIRNRQLLLIEFVPLICKGGDGGGGELGGGRGVGLLEKGDSPPPT